MLDTETKRRIDTARDILVGKVPDPKSQVEQITIALIYKFMDDMDAEAEEFGGARSFFAGEFEKYGWSQLMGAGLGGFEVLNLYAEAITRMNENPGIPVLFRDIFKNAYLPYRDPETLRSFLKIINDFTYEHSEKLGDAFEYLLSVLSSQGDAGQFRTPRHIIDFMVDVIDPHKSDSILDPACGAPRGAVWQYPNGRKEVRDEPVGTAAYLNAAEADSAGRGQRTRTCLKPGEHAARGGTPSRPQGCQPEPEQGHARNLCQKRPEGQHPGKRWRWDGSHRVIGMSHGGR